MPTITALKLRAYDYVTPRDRGYGQARRLNFRRSCALFVVTADDGIAGDGEADDAPRAIAAHLDNAATVRGYGADP